MKAKDDEVLDNEISLKLLKFWKFCTNQSRQWILLRFDCLKYKKYRCKQVLVLEFQRLIERVSW